ncbi:MAG TPA: hypothetical protein VFQ31_01245, partial [Methyloceanibacter sp.]|nr:hypothetical protein [Methyloceanibacter sp.]
WGECVRGISKPYSANSRDRGWTIAPPSIARPLAPQKPPNVSMANCIEGRMDDYIEVSWNGVIVRGALLPALQGLAISVLSKFISTPLGLREY